MFKFEDCTNRGETVKKVSKRCQKGVKNHSLWPSLVDTTRAYKARAFANALPQQVLQCCQPLPSHSFAIICHIPTSLCIITVDIIRVILGSSPVILFKCIRPQRDYCTSVCVIGWKADALVSQPIGSRKGN